MIGDTNVETNFPHTQVSRIRKPLANNSSANIKFCKTQVFKWNNQGDF